MERRKEDLSGRRGTLTKRAERKLSSWVWDVITLRVMSCRFRIGPCAARSMIVMCSCACKYVLLVSQQNLRNASAQQTKIEVSRGAYRSESRDDVALHERDKTCDREGRVHAGAYKTCHMSGNGHQGSAYALSRVRSLGDMGSRGLEQSWDRERRRRFSRNIGLQQKSCLEGVCDTMKCRCLPPCCAPRRSMPSRCCVENVAMSRFDLLAGVSGRGV